MVEPSIVKKTKTRTRVHDEGGGISHEEAEGQRTRNKDERIRGTMDTGEDGRYRLEPSPRKEERREQSKEGIIDERRFFFY